MTSGAGDIIVRHFSGSQGLDALRQDWATLAKSLSPSRFFHLYEWHRAYLDALESDADSVHFFALYRNGSVVGIVPLKCSTHPLHGISLRQLELPQHPHLTLCDAVFGRAPENKTLLAALCAHLSRQRDVPWDVLALPQTLEDSAVAFSLGAAPPSRLIRAACGFSRYVPCLESPEAMQARLPTAFRRNLRRLARHGEETGRIEYRTYRTREELAEAFPSFLCVEASGWKGARGDQSAIALHAPLRRFYTGLIDRCSPDGRCVINLLWLNDLCIAGQFGLLVDGVLYLLKIGYQESYSQLAPGNLLMEHVLEACSRDGSVRAVSFVTDPSWSHLWRPEASAVSTYYVFNRTSRGWMGYLAYRTARRLMSLIKARPRAQPPTPRRASERPGHQLLLP